MSGVLDEGECMEHAVWVKVLVVEDEKPIASFVRNGLEEQGYAVDLCDNGTDGLSLATTRNYDAIILDIMLPGRDGTEHSQIAAAEEQSRSRRHHHFPRRGGRTGGRIESGS